MYGLNFCCLQEDTKDKGWWEWPLPIRKREPEALADATAKHKTDIERFIALQYLFDRQWKAVKVHNGISWLSLARDTTLPFEYVGYLAPQRVMSCIVLTCPNLCQLLTSRD